MRELAVIGTGIGGSLISALNANKNPLVFEKDFNLGGCASTFTRGGFSYNTGATTLAGYEDNHIIKNMFDTISLKPKIIPSDVAIEVNINNKKISRTTNFDEFLDQINENFPNQNNENFWKTIYDIHQKFWKLKNIYYGKYSLKNYYKTSVFIFELLKSFKFNLFTSAQKFISDTLGDISKDYLDFINAQLLITVQSDVKDLTLLSLALGLSYPFHKVYYVENGMGSLIEQILETVDLHTNEKIQNIIQHKNSWILQSNNDEYETKQLILNSSVYQNKELFASKEIQNYYDQFEFSDQSAFVVYLTIKSNEEYLDHYQFIENENLPNCISNSFFVSISHKDDQVLSKDGTRSITISTHSKALFWKQLSKEEYKEQKAITQEFIVNKFLEYFPNIQKENIIKEFSATSLTFNRYINRYNCGGKAIGLRNISQLPSCNTPFKGLYNVGDTVFAGQGWPGVAIGVDVLQRHLDGIS